MKKGAVIACQQCIAQMYNSGYQGQWQLTPDGIECEVHNRTPLKPVPNEPKGLKFDTEKAPLDLLPYEALEEVGRVLAAGERKYGTANWANGIEMRRLIAAAMRHLGQFNAGEDKDAETDTLHLANAACNLMFAIWMYKHRPDLDNRWSKQIKK